LIAILPLWGDLGLFRVFDSPNFHNFFTKSNDRSTGACLTDQGDVRVLARVIFSQFSHGQVASIPSVSQQSPGRAQDCRPAGIGWSPGYPGRVSSMPVWQESAMKRWRGRVAITAVVDIDSGLVILLFVSRSVRLPDSACRIM